LQPTRGAANREVTTKPLKSAANDTPLLLLFDMTDETPNTLAGTHGGP
jgi:hypothetical protein